MKLAQLILLWLPYFANAQIIPQSPCPQIFRYESDGYSTYGVLTTLDSFGPTINIHLQLSLPTQLPSSFVGTIDLYENKARLSSKLAAGLPISYKVTFPVPSPLPYLSSVSVNDRVICSGPSAGGQYVTKISLDHSLQTGNSQRPQQRPRPSYQQQPQQTYQQQPQQTYQQQPQQTYQQDPQQQRPLAYQPNPPQQTSYQVNPPPQQVYEQSTPDYYQQPATNSYNYVTTTTTTESYQPPSRFQQSSNGACGIKNSKNSNSVALVVHGQVAEKGEWPWLVALYRRTSGVLKFICGSSLISNRLVVTAAHCVADSKNQPIKSENIVLRLGVHSIDDWGDADSTTRTVSEIRMNNYYKDRPFDNDIAVLVMTQTVEFTRYISPVCIWDGDDDQNQVVGLSGNVVGWGKDDDGDTNSEPQVVDVPIVSTTTCRGSNPIFFQMTSDTTLCAGSREGSGPCTGDSGGGLYIEKNQRWYIRGIVSHAISDKEKTCNLFEYVVYTDCAKYTSWINGI